MRAARDFRRRIPRGGSIVSGEVAETDPVIADSMTVAYPFTTSDEFLAVGLATRLGIEEVILANDRAWRPEADMHDKYKGTSLGGLTVSVTEC